MQKQNRSIFSLNRKQITFYLKVFYSVIFYTGERITLKDNNLVYNPGSSQKSSLISRIETSKEAIKKTSKELVNYNIIIKMFQ